MRHHTWSQEETYDIAILMKNSSFNKEEIISGYVKPLVAKGVSQNSMIAFTLEYEVGKAPVKLIKEYLAKLLPELEELKVKFLYVTDSNYFKTLTGQLKADPHHGYVLPCKLKGYEHMQVVLGLNYQQLIYNPALQAKLDLSLDTLASAIKGNYQAIGTGIIHSAWYPETLQDIAAALQSLHQYESLSCDIETFSLRFNEAGIGTIAFAWDKHNGIAFACDSKDVFDCLGHIDACSDVDPAAHYSFNSPHYPIRKLLLEFFQTYKGELTFHNGVYDVKVIIYVLWMQSLLDTQGLLTGLDVMTRSFQDTKIIAYLATNSTAGNILGLKSLAHEFAGNYAVEDIKDIRKIPLKELLEYNLVDALSTNYVKGKYYPIMVQDKQEELYKTLMLPSLKLIIQMELTGMPLSKSKVQEVKEKLEVIQAKHLTVIRESSFIKALDLLLQTSEMEKANAKLKVKQHPLSKFADVTFNPNSGPQLQKLLYEQMQLPVIDLTDTKQPATGADTIEKLINHTTEPVFKDVLEALIGNGKVTKILSTFIPAFEAAIEKGTDDIVWLHGSFNLGGTVSGRLSSSAPNLQNLPSGSEYGDLIKSCFMAPKGWLFCGADFNSLEDMISALTTKDPNKIAVYTKGYDGHCLRAAYYFKDELLDIDLTDVNSVNSIKKKYPTFRQDSKAPTFALTYQGTWRTLMNNLGWPEDKCKSIENNYHEMYKVSDEYIQTRLHQASKDGYTEVAFGLRVRTPLLKQVIYGSKKVPYEAAAEARTAGNAMGQSYGLLNNRAAVDFWNKVWNSKYRYDVLPSALIHDAIYPIVRDDIEIIEWVNTELIKSMQWQELPEIQHDEVKLGAALDIFWPSWKDKITLPNNADQAAILAICKEAKEAIS